MGRRKRRSEFEESALMNNYTWRQYYNRLMQLGMVMFEYENMPKEIDERFLEKTLFNKGNTIFFKDEDLSINGSTDGSFLVLPSANYGKFDVYDVPVERRAYATNGYQRQLNSDDSVIIYNNYLRTNSRLDVEMFAKKLYNIDRAIDVNANAQKTPILLLCEENQRLSYINLYKEYDGNAPVIKGTTGLDLEGFQVLKTDAPYVADKLYELKTNIWNEALTYLGITNITYSKKERMITDEVNRMIGGTLANRYSRLLARQQALNKINDMFGLNISVRYRDEVEQMASLDDREGEGDE